MTAGLPVSSPSPSKLKLIQQVYTLLLEIEAAEQNPEAPIGGVDIVRNGQQISGNFRFPVERVPSQEGEMLRFVDFLK